MQILQTNGRPSCRLFNNGTGDGEGKYPDPRAGVEGLYSRCRFRKEPGGKNAGTRENLRARAGRRAIFQRGCPPRIRFSSEKPSWIFWCSRGLFVKDRRLSRNMTTFAFYALRSNRVGLLFFLRYSPGRQKREKRWFCQGSNSKSAAR